MDQSRDPSSRHQQQEHQMPKGSFGRKDKAAHREGGVRREWGKGVGGSVENEVRGVIFDGIACRQLSA